MNTKSLSHRYYEKELENIINPTHEQIREYGTICFHEGMRAHAVQYGTFEQAKTIDGYLETLAKNNGLAVTAKDNVR